MTSLKIQYRYFEQNTIGYLHSYRESDNFLNRWGMMGLLLLVGCTPSSDTHHIQHSLLLFTVQPFYATHCQRQWFYTLRKIVSPPLNRVSCCLNIFGGRLSAIDILQAWKTKLRKIWSESARFLNAKYPHIVVKKLTLL